MIVQLTGTLLEVTPSRVVLDAGGVGFELGVSSTTAASLPHAGEAGVTVLVRMIVREDAMELYGFATREERALFDQLRAISGVGPKLALSVLSTFSPAALDHGCERLFTDDASRAARDGERHYGLGLYTAAEAACAHGGSISLANRPSGGAIVTLTIPL